MARALLIKLHLYCSAFFAPDLGGGVRGLYLIGIKGTIEQTPVGTLTTGQQLSQDPSEQTCRRHWLSWCRDFEFEYVKQEGSQLITRPTTRPFYTLDISGDEAMVQYNEPSLQKRMIELHMGHGPTAYKTYQKVFAAGMLFIILTGLWLGLSSARLRVSTAMISGAGVLLFFWLALS